MAAKTSFVDVYSSRYILTLQGDILRLVDFSGGVVLDEQLDRGIVKISVSQETTKQLPKIFALTRKGEVLHYTLNVKKTNKKNKIDYKLTLRHQFDLFMVNPLETWPANFQLSNRKFVFFQATETKNFLCFYLADTMGNL